MMPVYMASGSFLSGARDGIYFRRWKSVLVEIPKSHGVEIHTKEDLALAEFYLKRRLAK